MSGFLSSFATFEEYRQSLYTIKRPNTSFIQEDNSIRVLDGRFDNVYSFGDVIFYDNILDKLEVVNGDNTELLQSFANNSSRYIPQALCVIPTGLIDNKARFINVDKNMSGMWENNSVYKEWIKWKDSNNKQHSISDYNIISGDPTSDWKNYYYRYDIPGLANRANIRPTVSLSDTTSINNEGSTWLRTAMERNDFSKACPWNSNLKYYSSSPYTYPLYNEDWSLNKYMFNLNDLSSSYLKDRNGKSNTQILMNLHGTYISGATAWSGSYGYQYIANNTTDITSSGDTLFFPAALLCYEYYTDVFPIHSWFLPSITELTLAFIRYDSINRILTLINGITINSSVYWSSTEYSDRSAAYFYTSNGNIRNDGKYNSYYVRAFLSL